MNPHVRIVCHIVLETRICYSARFSSIGTLPEVLGISLCHYNFLHLFIAHNTAPKYTTNIWLFSTVHDLCLVFLMHTLGVVLPSANVHIRLYSSWTHVVEHNLSFSISSPFFVECGSVNSTVSLRGTAHEVGVLNLDSSHVVSRVLPSMCILS